MFVYRHHEMVVYCQTIGKFNKSRNIKLYKVVASQKGGGVIDNNYLIMRPCVVNKKEHILKEFKDRMH